MIEQWTISKKRQCFNSAGNKNDGGQKHAKFGPILHNFRLLQSRTAGYLEHSLE